MLNQLELLEVKAQVHTGRTYEQIESNPKTLCNRGAIDLLKEEYAPVQNPEEITETSV
jgi:hypothetical protein